MKDDVKISALERLKLKKFVNELEQYKGRHTELVSVYVPSGYDLNAIINHLQEEQGTAQNIKSKTTRQNVTDALERMIQHLKLFSKTPQNGMAVFSGNVAEREGQSNVQVWSIEPPVPLKQRLYRCDKTFVLEPLAEMASAENVYGLVVMDMKDAAIALLKGKSIQILKKTHSEVPGKMRAGGQCLTGSTLVQVSDGNIQKIRYMHNPLALKGADFKSYSITDSNIIDVWRVKEKEVYRIITKSPRIEIESSKDHTFFVYCEEGIKEKRAEQLKNRDLLIMPEKISCKGEIQKLESVLYHRSFRINKEGRELLRRMRISQGLCQREMADKIGLSPSHISMTERGVQAVRFESIKKYCRFLELDYDWFIEEFCRSESKLILPNTLTQNLSQILGYFLGDGSMEKERICFSEQRKGIAVFYERLLKKVFNANIRLKFREDKGYWQLRAYGEPIVEFIRQEFPEIKKAKNSMIPQKVLNSPDNVLASFLKGLFDAEGYISVRGGVSLGINNKLLAQQIQMALLRFGIISSLHRYDNRRNPYSNNIRFTIDFTEKKSLRLFRDKIGFTAKDKKNKLNAIIRKKTDKSYVRQIIIPGRRIREILTIEGYKLRDFPTVTNFFRNERMMSKQAFKKSILSHIKEERLKNRLAKILDCSLVPVQIKEIVRTGRRREMIDVAVKNQNFIANCVIVHNSAPRFQRLRAGAIKQHYKKIAEYMKKEFLNLPGLKGIIIGGPSTTITNFLNKEYITGDVEKRIIGTKDLSYTGEFGLRQLVEASQDLLAKEEISEEVMLVKRFLETLAKKEAFAAYGEAEVERCLDMGAVDTLLISEEYPQKKIEMLEKKAEASGTNVKIISTTTTEGQQIKELGMIAAILRYPVHA